MTPITLTCNICEHRFQIPPAKKEKRILWLITLAICPACGSEQNPEQCRLYDGQKRCRGCHLPEGVLPREERKIKGKIYFQVFTNHLCQPCRSLERRGIFLRSTNDPFARI